VTDRNALAHRFLNSGGVNINSEEGIRNAAKFLIALREQAIHVRKTMQGLMTAILGGEPRNEEDEQYIRFAKHVFFGGSLYEGNS
jgi:hypothetical protein